ncbi:MAG TPA: flagellar filament capping protein FliD [Candidatus Binatia bacterium]|nr:flagellar filament capping protein FliD [Candidatus Binatia bacterium]
MSSIGNSLYGSTLGDIVNNVNDAFSGKTSGIDVNSIVSELMQVERQPETQMQQEQSTISSQLSALTAISTQLTTLYNSVNSLKDFNGAFSQKTTGSSDSAVVSASADQTAAAGTHSVTVTNLATTSSSYSGYIPSGTSLAGAEIDVKYGSDPNHPLKTDTIVIPSGDTTLQQAASYINSGSYGVTASVVSDSQGSRLVLLSKTSGAAGNLTVSSAAAAFTSSAGVDAQLSIDGVPFDSSTNTITGAIAGVTLSLGAAAPNTPVLISVQPDTSQATQAIQNFVDAYNAVIGSINAQFTVDPTTQNEGVLAGDSMLRPLQSDLLQMAATQVSGLGPYVNLQSLGIEMQDDGTLQIDSATLSAALSSDFSDMQNFFQSTSPAGWGQSAGTQMLQLTDPTLGPVAVDISGLNQTNQDLTNQISDFEDNMAVVQQQLTDQYSNLNALLQQYPLEMQEIASQLASLPGASGSGNNQG